MIIFVQDSHHVSCSSEGIERATPDFSHISNSLLRFAMGSSSDVYKMFANRVPSGTLHEQLSNASLANEPSTLSESKVTTASTHSPSFGTHVQLMFPLMHELSLICHTLCQLNYDDSDFQFHHMPDIVFTIYCHFGVMQVCLSRFLSAYNCLTAIN